MASSGFPVVSIKASTRLALISFWAALFVASFLASPSLARNAQVVAASADLQINIEEDNDTYGVIKIDLLSPQASTQAIYFLLPFHVEGNVETEQGIYVSYEIVDEGISNGFTILNVILSPGISSNPQISFRIRPLIRRSSDFAFASLSIKTNYFIIEDRGGTRNTLYLRFDVQGKTQSFGSTSQLLESEHIVIPKQIIINFPQDTIFEATPPTFLSSNISEGPYPGIQQGTSFITDTRFYELQFLRVNYVLNSLTTRPGVIIYVVIILLITFVPGILAFPDDMLSKRARLILATIFILVAPLLFLINWMYEGPQYLIENSLLLIGGGIAYVFVAFVLVLQAIPQLKQKLKDLRSPQG